jgi:UDP-N-acetylglucosamine 1-carboxyvinyltransferase
MARKLNNLTIVNNGGNEILRIVGGKPLTGEVVISGSKNASLPIMAATLLTKGDFVLSNVPDLADVRVFAEVLRGLGCKSSYDTGRFYIENSSLANLALDSELVGRMRASVLVMGPLLARFGEIKVPLPGGCSLGPRPIDFHLKGFEQLGAEVVDTNGAIEVRVPNGFRGTTIELPFPSVGATENLMMSATLAIGTTVIENAAREPEIADLANFLIQMGAQINGAGTSTITIRGASTLCPVNYHVIPDRIETASYLMAGLITGGEITCVKASPYHLAAIIEKLEEAGCRIRISDSTIGIKAPKRPISVGVKTAPYPGFATDIQPMLMAAMTTSKGKNIFMDTIFSNRFNQVAELKKLGADIVVKNHVALVRGRPGLRGCDVVAPDIRASMAIVIAGLKADGETRIGSLGHLFRGYENPINKLRDLGAEVYLEQGKEKESASNISDCAGKIPPISDVSEDAQTTTQI